MSIQLNISPRIITSIASLYSDINRIFMEYIDNALDSAEIFYDHKTNSYSKNISITLTMSNHSVAVEDNCFGITNFEKIVQSVGNSDKKTDAWSNGQFGYGIYSFMAACESLNIVSKLDGEPAKEINISRDQFNEDLQENVVFQDPIITNYPHTSGTRAVLSGFDKSMWKQINFSEIRNEIESHFELLLSRKNLQINLVNSDNGTSHICKTFDYDSYDGEIYEDEIDTVALTKRKGGKKQEIKMMLDRHISIFIKITKGKSLKRPPVFVSKGRRIGSIKDIKQFKSSFKSEIWGHPNVTGYVDLSGNLEPNIARTDFKNTDKSKAIFITLIEIEPLILEVIRDVNKESDSKHYKTLEDELNKALSKLARVDSMNFRTENLSGNDVNLQQGGVGQEFEQGLGDEHQREGDRRGAHNEIDPVPYEDPDGFGPTGEDGDRPSDEEGNGNLASDKEAENPFEDTGLTGGKRKKSGFNIQFVDGHPNESQDGKLQRSQLIDGSIRIFREHPDFEKRIHYTRTKEPQITQRLVTYLAGEITVHYKDKFQTRAGQPTYDIHMFEDLVEFIYKFEEMVSGLVGKNLSDFEE